MSTIHFGTKRSSGEGSNTFRMKKTNKKSTTRHHTTKTTAKRAPPTNIKRVSAKPPFVLSPPDVLPPKRGTEDKGLGTAYNVTWEATLRWSHGSLGLTVSRRDIQVVKVTKHTASEGYIAVGDYLLGLNGKTLRHQSQLKQMLTDVKLPTTMTFKMGRWHESRVGYRYVVVSFKQMHTFAEMGISVEHWPRRGMLINALEPQGLGQVYFQLGDIVVDFNTTDVRHEEQEVDCAAFAEYDCVRAGVERAATPERQREISNKLRSGPPSITMAADTMDAMLKQRRVLRKQGPVPAPAPSALRNQTASTAKSILRTLSGYNTPADVDDRHINMEKCHTVVKIESDVSPGRKLHPPPRKPKGKFPPNTKRSHVNV